MTISVRLGFEVGSGKAVDIPLRHLAVTGQTQEAGKTTTLEALISRSGLRAITFITKRGEGSFRRSNRVEPYFREQTDWQFVASILEASRGEKLKFERACIIRASRGARTLAGVHDNVRASLAKLKGGRDADVYTVLDAYLDVVVPLISSVKWATSVELLPGVNVMDLGGMALEMQHLVIRSTINWVLEKEEDTVIVVPEAWKFIPQGRGTPVKLAAEALIRQGAALRNYLWLDSQDLGGIEKSILRSVPVWLLGVQREANEIKRTLDNIPASAHKPKPDAIAQLRIGQFFACWSDKTLKTYVQPAWMEEDAAMAVARGEKAAPPPPLPRAMSRPRPPAPSTPKEESPQMCTEHQAAQREAERLQAELHETRKNNLMLVGNLADANNRAEAAVALGHALARLLPASSGGAVVDEDAIVRRVLERIDDLSPMRGCTITVTPPEKLRLDFQREEADRIVAAARSLDPLSRRILKLLVAIEVRVTQGEISERLGRSSSGGAMATLRAAVKALAVERWIDVASNGITTRLRQKIESDLSTYKASDGDVEAVYQTVLHAIATEE